MASRREEEEEHRPQGVERVLPILVWCAEFEDFVMAAIRRLFARPGELGRCSPYSLGGWSILREQSSRKDEMSGRRRTAYSEAAAAPERRRYGGHLPKVSDRLINVTLVSPIDGSRHNLKALWGEGLTLLDALKRAGVDTGCPCQVHEKGVEVCMGNCAVLVATEWLDTMPPRTEDETEVLRLRLQTGGVAPASIDKHIRLSCVLPLGPEHEGMNVGLTEPVAGETP